MAPISRQRVTEHINRHVQDLISKLASGDVEAKFEEVEGDFEFVLDPEVALTLLLGQITHEGVTSALKASGRQYKQKILESSVANWKSIVELFAHYNVTEVIWKVFPSTCDALVDDDYTEIGRRLLAEIASRPHVLFVHQDLLSGRTDEDSFSHEKSKVLANFQQLVAEYRLNVIPYQRNAEATVLALEFIAQTEQGLLLRIYVPSRRLWANETDKLLQLFRDYLSRVSKLNVRLDQTRTDLGIIYEFHGGKEDACDLASEFNEFASFVDLCATNPDGAQAILTDRNVDIHEVGSIMTRYAKEARRLHVDMKHDREQKILGIRQRLESELVDVLPDVQSLGTLLEAVLPTYGNSQAALSMERAPLQITSANNVTVNLNPQVVHAIDSIVAQEIHGDVHLSKQDQELLSLIQRYEHDEQVQLTSAVYELADKSAPKPGRLLAKEKLTKFLIGCASKIGDVGAGVLQAYIQNQLGF